MRAPPPDTRGLARLLPDLEPIKKSDGPEVTCRRCSRRHARRAPCPGVRVVRDPQTRELVD